jgi:hypothetical protein
MARGQRLLLAISISVAVIGFIGLILNIRAALQSAPASAESPARSISKDAEAQVEAQEKSEEKPEDKPQEKPVAVVTPEMSTSPEASAAPKKAFPAKQELVELLKKSQEESKDCKSNVNKARAKLSKSLMSAEEFKQALRLLEETPLTPPSSQQIYEAFEEGMPAEWDGSAFLRQVISAGGCDTLIHYKLLKSVAEKAAKHPKLFPLEQIRSATRAFLTLGTDKPSPLLIELMRISLLKDMVQIKEIDPAFEQKVMELQQSGQGLSEKLQEDLHACQNAQDCLKSLPNEFEKSKSLREAYLRLVKEIWPN